MAGPNPWNRVIALSITSGRSLNPAGMAVEQVPVPSPSISEPQLEIEKIDVPGSEVMDAVAEEDARQKLANPGLSQQTGWHPV